MSWEVPGSVFLFLAAMFFAASLTFLMGVTGKKNPNSVPIGVGFALLAACFVWLWAA